MRWPTAQTEAGCVSHPTPTRRCAQVGQDLVALAQRGCLSTLPITAGTVFTIS